MSENEEILPKVSVNMITYNHENFIAEAIEGVLMQECDFPIELLIHDDASTDRTADIVREYEAKHPDIIKPIYQTENQYSQGKKPGLMNRARARGEYYAICEGDDYWTDPKKLQKQVDFMDAHPECSLCGHKVRIVDEEGNWDGQSIRPEKDVPEINDLKGLLETGYYIQTCSVLQRNYFIKEYPSWFYKIPAGDWGNKIMMAKRGKIGFIFDVMADYRIHSGGIYSSGINNITKQAITTKKQHEAMFNSWKILNKVVPRAYRKPIYYKIANSAGELYLISWNEKKRFKAICYIINALYFGNNFFSVRKGWNAFNNNKRISAILYAVIAIIGKPYRLDGWRLFACSFVK